MILTVTLNCTIDKTYVIENFHVDKIHQSQSVNMVPGGKGINVGRVFKELGGNVLLTGFAGGHNGDYIRDTTLAEGLASDFVKINGESRICTKIADPIAKTQTEINEVGPVISVDELDRMFIKFESIIMGMDYVILSGSIPPGVPSNVYSQLIEIAHKHNVKCLLDASGDSLSEGVNAKPSIIKPNVNELSELVGHQIATLEEATDAARSIFADGVETVIVTFGKNGAIALNKEGVWMAVPPTINYVNAVGSGDAFAAGFIYSLIKGNNVEQALKLGTGAGAANASTLGSGLCKKDDILHCAEQTKIMQI